MIKSHKKMTSPLFVPSWPLPESYFSIIQSQWESVKKIVSNIPAGENKVVLINIEDVIRSESYNYVPSLKKYFSTENDFLPGSRDLIEFILKKFNIIFMSKKDKETELETIVNNNNKTFTLYKVNNSDKFSNSLFFPKLEIISNISKKKKIVLTLDTDLNGFIGDFGIPVAVYNPWKFF